MKPDFGYSTDAKGLIGALIAPLGSRGIAAGGHFIQVGLGSGFYIPEHDKQMALARANETGKVQFVGLARDGSAIHGSRDALHAHPDCDGYIAWIFPAVER